MGTTASGRRRNRSWPVALKREIVAASLAPGSSVSLVARQYDVNANQVFSWRKLYRNEAAAAAAPAAGQMIPVIVEAEQDAAPPQSSRAAGMIEIGVLGKYCVRVGGDFKAQVLRRILDVLEHR